MGADSGVGCIDCGTYDRWATWEGGPGRSCVIDTSSVPPAAWAAERAVRLRTGQALCTE